MSVSELGVWLHDRQVAILRAPRIGRVTCEYLGSILDEQPLNSPVLSCSLPSRTGRRDAWAFTTGLLPEGQHRQEMAARAGVTTSNLLGMLNRFGRDVAGAVVISADDPPIREASAEPYTSETLAEAVSELDDHPLGLYDDSELSVAGVQDKMLLVADGDGWARPVHGYPSTHILKVDDRVRRGLVRAEHACLTLARLAGLPAAASTVLTIGDAECIVVARFDRSTEPTGAVGRIHQEDSCQALGVDPEQNRRLAKYEEYGGPRLAQIAALLDAWGGEGFDELGALLDQVVFTVAIGNADAHGKNVSLLHPEPGRISLSPLYDTVPTALWPKLRRSAAMKVNGRADLSRITLSDIVAEAERWNMEPRQAHARAIAVAERLLDVLRAGDVDVDTPALELIAGRLGKLLN